ncbi:Transmembrane channel-like protein 7 [Lamellibrachia satsuma]|nr:Transmembrane channel-like protein 7 [Lamellibrachia satsuma]
MADEEKQDAPDGSTLPESANVQSPSPLDAQAVDPGLSSGRVAGRGRQRTSIMAPGVRRKPPRFTHPGARGRARGPRPRAPVPGGSRAPVASAMPSSHQTPTTAPQSDLPPVATAVESSDQPPITAQQQSDLPPVATAVKSSDQPPITAETQSDLPPVARAVESSDQPPITAQQQSDLPPVATAMKSTDERPTSVQNPSDLPPVATAVKSSDKPPSTAQQQSAIYSGTTSGQSIGQPPTAVPQPENVFPGFPQFPGALVGSHMGSFAPMGSPRMRLDMYRQGMPRQFRPRARGGRMSVAMQRGMAAMMMANAASQRMPTVNTSATEAGTSRLRPDVYAAMLGRRSPRLERVDLTERDVTPEQRMKQLRFIQNMYPRQVNLKKLKAEENPIACLELVKNLALPVCAKHILRDYLSLNDIKAGKSFMAKQKMVAKKAKEKAKETSVRMSIWTTSFKTIEGRFGSGVASYFVFLRWLFIVNTVTCLVPVFFLVIPAVTSPKHPYSSAVALNISESRIAIVDQCSMQYKNITKQYVMPKTEEELNNFDFSSFFTDVLQGTGGLERTPLFYGYYENKIHGDHNAQPYNMPMAYLIVTFVYLLANLLFLMLRIATTEDGSDAEVQKEGRGIVYSQIVFVTWNYNVTDFNSSFLQHRTIYADIVVHLEDEKERQRRLNRSKLNWCGLYTLRLFINIIVLATLVGVTALVYFITFVASRNLSRNISASSTVNLIYEYLPSITITLINIIVPKIFGNLIPWEQYHADVQLGVVLARTIALRMVSLVMLLVTVYIQVTCTPVDECNVGLKPDCQSFKCWETYVGQQIYKLVIMDLIASLIGVFLVDFPRRIFVNKCGSFPCLRPTTFNIPKNVLHLVYCQTLCWLSVFFMPLAPAITAVKCLLLFYLRKMTCIMNYVPEERPFQASSASSLFVRVLMASFAISTVPVLFIILGLAPSRGCGPVRLYDNLYGIIPVWTQSLPPGPSRDFIMSMTTPAFIIPLYLFTLVILYYYSSKARRHKNIAKKLRLQLKLESADKGYLAKKMAFMKKKMTLSEGAPMPSSLRSKPKTNADATPIAAFVDNAN